MLKWGYRANGVSDKDTYWVNIYIVSAPDQTFTEVRAVPTTTKHDGDYEMIIANLWLSRCLSEHESCTSNNHPQQYPRRLLEIWRHKVFLIDCRKARPRGPYATLSHCWGESHFLS